MLFSSPSWAELPDTVFKCSFANTETTEELRELKGKFEGDLYESIIVDIKNRNGYGEISNSMIKTCSNSNREKINFELLRKYIILKMKIELLQ